MEGEFKPWRKSLIKIWPEARKQSAEFRKYGSSSCLIGTEKAIKNVIFDPIGLQDLRKAIELMQYFGITAENIVEKVAK